jgi:gliding motility-associated-like protein
MLRKLVFLLGFFTPCTVWAQLPPGQPQQDCIGAIPVCQGVYFEPASYQGVNGTSTNPADCNGLICNEINPAISCLLSGERNSVWYTFTVQGTGLFGFNITPNILADDYDWAIYNLTNSNCSAIYTNAALQVACNYSGTPGVTGCNLPVGSGIVGQNNPVFPVVAGQTYVLVVSNFETNPNNANGFTINLLPPPVIPVGGSATIIGDTTQARFTADTLIYCGRTIGVRFSERILRDSLNNQSFRVVSPTGVQLPVTNIACNNCVSNRGTIFTITFLNNSSGQNYKLILVDSIPDACGNIAKLDTVEFDVLPRQITFVPQQTNICIGDNITIASTMFPADTYNHSWSGPQINGPSTNPSVFVSPQVSSFYRLQVTSLQGCISRDSIEIKVFPLPLPGDVSPDQSNLCFGDSLRLIVTSPSITIDSASSIWRSLGPNEDILAVKQVSNDTTWVVPRLGNRLIRLQARIISRGGCANFSDTARIQVGKNMIPSFEADTLSGIVPFEVGFADFSTSDFNRESDATRKWFVENTTLNPGVRVQFGDSTWAKYRFENFGKHRIILQLSDQLGCTKEVEQIIDAKQFILPNVITPNEDGLNDRFVVLGRVSGLELKIFNRWGRQVFSDMDYKNTFDGRELESGVYYFSLNDIQTGNSYTGWIQLIK